MNYELYIDLLFLENFMMDVLLLMTVRTFLKCKASFCRIFVGGAAGAGLMCAVIAISCPVYVKYPLLYLVIPCMMLVIGLRIRTAILFFRACVLLYVSAFLMGGIILFVRPHIWIGGLFYLTAVISYYLIHLVWETITRLKNIQQKQCNVTLYIGVQTHDIQALADTGNVLTDSFTSQPVHVISKVLADQIWGRHKPIQECRVRYIPYCTVNGNGVMPVLIIERMCVHLQEDIWIENPLLGISEEKLSENEEYQMLLNTDILGGVRNGCKCNGSTTV